MSNKQKVGNQSKKSSNSLPMKEIFQQNQLTTDLLRSINSRSDDMIILKSISDRKTGKLRLQTAFAEKTIQEIESKEDWRICREDQVLSQLLNGKLEAPLHKKQFEKQTKKMLKINSQFDDEPSEKDLNLTEMHVNKVMNMKIGPENTSITYNQKGQQCVSVPSATIPVSSWKDLFSKTSRVIESILSSETVNIYPAVFCCVQVSRSHYQQEITRQKQAVEEGGNFLTPNIAVIITSKKKTVIKSPSPSAKLAILPEPDFSQPIFKQLLELNSTCIKNVKNFIANAVERRENERIPKTSDKIEKTLRLRNYEKYSAISPARSAGRSALLTVRTRFQLQRMPNIVFDLENPYFDESKTLADRVKVIHFCIAIQKWFRKRRNLRLGENAIKIQKVFRGFLTRKVFFLKKLEKFRKVFHLARLRHWYPLMVNKFRERKGGMIEMNHFLFEKEIVFIQKHVRGFLVRKHLVIWKKEVRKNRKNKEFERFHWNKIGIWKACFNCEDLAVDHSCSVASDITEYIRLNDFIKKDEKMLNEFVKIKDQVESEIRQEYLIDAKTERIKFLE
jgi:hypothetical protein